MAVSCTYSKTKTKPTKLKLAGLAKTQGSENNQSKNRKYIEQVRTKTETIQTPQTTIVVCVLFAYVLCICCLCCVYVLCIFGVPNSGLCILTGWLLFLYLGFELPR